MIKLKTLFFVNMTQLTLPPQIRVQILKGYRRVFQYVDSRLPRDLYYVVSFSRMIVNTAAILSDNRGNQYKHGWTKDDLDKLKELGLFEHIFPINDISRIFLYDVDSSVDYDYINWKLAGGKYASLAAYTDDDHDMEEKLLILKNKLELSIGNGCTDSCEILDTFNELFDSQLTLYQQYLDLVKTCKVLLLEDITRLQEESAKALP
jgi:hypothetical protein